MNNIVLASASPRRKEILEQIGVSFSIIPSTIEEKITKQKPNEVVEELAMQKALDVFNLVGKKGIVIGADTIVSLDTAIMGKPKDERAAYNMLNKLQGKTHIVYTGVCVYINNGDSIKHIVFSEATSVTMYEMSEKQIYDYIATKEPMDKAGAYGIQGKSAIYIKGIEGDYNNVVGLPVARLYQELYKIGIDITNKNLSR